MSINLGSMDAWSRWAFFGILFPDAPVLALILWGMSALGWIQ